MIHARPRKVYLRDTTVDDRELLYIWANDPTARASAFNTARISYEEHCRWFDHMINDNSERQYILMDGDEPIGQIRLSLSERIAEMDYSIDSSRRGQGYGSTIIRLAKEKVFEEYPQVERLIARVKMENRASSSCFQKNQFKAVFCQYEYYMGDYRPEE